MDEEREREIITRPGLAKAFLKTCLVIILGTAGMYDKFDVRICSGSLLEKLSSRVPCKLKFSLDE